MQSVELLFTRQFKIVFGKLVFRRFSAPEVNVEPTSFKFDQGKFIAVKQYTIATMKMIVKLFYTAFDLDKYDQRHFGMEAKHPSASSRNKRERN